VNITLFSNKFVHVDEEEGGGRAGGKNAAGCGGGVAMIICKYKILNTGKVSVSCYILF
jgi:hypothetical protein